MSFNKFSKDKAITYEQIKQISEILRKQDYVNTVILIGSYAREDYNEFSDIDIVVIINKNIERSKLSDLVSNSPLVNKLSLLPYYEEIFKFMYKNGNLFVKHVVTEGKVLYDDGFFSKLIHEVLPNSHRDSLRKLKSIDKRLRLYENPSIFNNLYIDCLSQIYKMFSGIMISSLDLKEKPEFNKQKSLKQFIECYPNLKEDVLSLNELRPFVLAKKGAFKYPNQSLPIVTHDEFEDKLKRFRKIIHVIESEYRTKNN